MYVTPSSNPRPSPVEHIVTLAINIDDEKIIRGVEEAAQSQIVRELKSDFVKSIFQSRYSYSSGKDDVDYSSVQRWVECEFESFLEENKTAIIEAAGKYLSEKLARTKAVKEMVESQIKGGGGNTDE